MSILSKIKNIFLDDDKSSFQNAHGINVSIEELVKEQYNIAGLNFFATSTKNIMAGTSSSPFKGKGMEFDEVRVYQAGDDVRTIDWRVTARRGETYTKLFKEERERQIIILADMRPPMHFGTKVQFKSVIAAKISALISWIALDASEKIGGIVVSDEKTSIHKPHSSRKKVLTFLNSLVNASLVETEKNEKTLSMMLSELRHITRTGGIVFIISDFHDFDDTAKRYLTQISGKCDVVAINIYDKLEEKAPPEDRYLVTDGQRTLTLYADDYSWREEYEAFFKNKRDKFEDFCKKHKVKNIFIRTDENPSIALRTAFMTKKKR